MYTHSHTFKHVDKSIIINLRLRRYIIPLESFINGIHEIYIIMYFSNMFGAAFSPFVIFSKDNSFIIIMSILNCNRSHIRCIVTIYYFVCHFCMSTSCYCKYLIINHCLIDRFAKLIFLCSYCRIYNVDYSFNKVSRKLSFSSIYSFFIF